MIPLAVIAVPLQAVLRFRGEEGETDSPSSFLDCDAEGIGFVAVDDYSLLRTGCRQPGSVVVPIAERISYVRSSRNT